jgi:hypothetical protein
VLYDVRGSSAYSEIGIVRQCSSTSALTLLWALFFRCSISLSIAFALALVLTLLLVLVRREGGRKEVCPRSSRRSDNRLLFWIFLLLRLGFFLLLGGLVLVDAPVMRSLSGVSPRRGGERVLEIWI